MNRDGGERVMRWERRTGTGLVALAVLVLPVLRPLRALTAEIAAAVPSGAAAPPAWSGRVRSGGRGWGGFR